MVGYFTHSPSGCYWYRILHPMIALKNAGIPVVMFEPNKDIDVEVYNSVDTVQFYGSYPFSMEPVINELKSAGKRIVYDLDDALELIDQTNPLYYDIKKARGSSPQMFKAADIVTVSTPNMAEYAKARTDKSVVVVPNCFSSKEWDFQRVSHDGLRIGFAGSPTHIDDLNMVLPSIKEIQLKYPETTFILFGLGHKDLQSFLNVMRFTAPFETLLSVEKFATLMKGINYEWVQDTTFDKYPQKLIELSLDIGICPLKSTPFNDCRSASKAMEYTLAGALALASDVEPYRNEPTSILVKDNEWFGILNTIVPRTLEAKKIGAEPYQVQKSLEWLKENRNIDSQTDLLKSIYVV